MEDSVARCGGDFQIPALLVLIVPFGWMVVFLGALFVLCSRDVGEDGGGKVPLKSLKQQVR